MRKTLLGIGLGLSATLVALWVGQLAFVQTVELKTYDWRMRVMSDPASASKDIVLVEIDEQSLQRLAPVVGRWPWPRLVHAQLFNFLARAHPKAVLYDVQFTEPDRRTFTVGGQEWTGADSDAELAAAVKNLGVAVMLGNAVPESSPTGGPRTTGAATTGYPVHSRCVDSSSARSSFRPSRPSSGPPGWSPTSSSSSTPMARSDGTCR